jgi:hypothetical protein
MRVSSPFHSALSPLFYHSATDEDDDDDEVKEGLILNKTKIATERMRKMRKD